MPTTRRSLLAAPALAQQAAWPTRPIRFVGPFAPAGGSGIVARRLVEALAPRLGQPVIAEDRPRVEYRDTVCLSYRAAQEAAQWSCRPATRPVPPRAS